MRQLIFIFFTLVCSLSMSGLCLAKDVGNMAKATNDQSIERATEALHSQKDIVRVRGSYTMSNLLGKLARQFNKQFEQGHVNVFGSGTEDGIKGLLDGTVDVAMVARLLEKPEKAKLRDSDVKVARRLMGWDGVAVFIHPSNPLQTLSMEQLRKVYTGGYTSWKQLGGPDLPIEVFSGDPNVLGNSVFFKNYVLKNAPMSPEVRIRPLSDTVVKLVANKKYGIGYASLYKIKELSPTFKVKIMGIKEEKTKLAVKPSKETVADRSYPLIRPLFLYYPREKCGDKCMGFIEHCATMGLGLR